MRAPGEPEQNHEEGAAAPGHCFGTTPGRGKGWRQRKRLKAAAEGVDESADWGRNNRGRIVECCEEIKWNDKY